MLTGWFFYLKMVLCEQERKKEKREKSEEFLSSIETRDERKNVVVSCLLWLSRKVEPKSKQSPSGNLEPEEERTA